jgi:hypothetical protein
MSSPPPLQRKNKNIVLEEAVDDLFIALGQVVSLEPQKRTDWRRRLVARGISASQAEALRGLVLGMMATEAADLKKMIEQGAPVELIVEYLAAPADSEPAKTERRGEIRDRREVGRFKRSSRRTSDTLKALRLQAGVAAEELYGYSANESMILSHFHGLFWPEKLLLAHLSPFEVRAALLGPPEALQDILKYRAPRTLLARIVLRISKSGVVAKASSYVRQKSKNIAKPKTAH